GRPREAEASYRRALDLFARLEREGPDAALFRSRRAAGLNNLGELLFQGGRLHEATAAHRQALALLPPAGADAAQGPAGRAQPARSLCLRGQAGEGNAQPGQAEEVQRQGLALQQQLVREFPTKPAYRAGLALQFSHYGVVLSRLHRAREAEAAHRQSL